MFLISLTKLTLADPGTQVQIRYRLFIHCGGGILPGSLEFRVAQANLSLSILPHLP